MMCCIRSVIFTIISLGMLLGQTMDGQPQKVSYQLKAWSNGSGSIVGAINTNFELSAIAGQSLTGESLNSFYIIQSGFWPQYPVVTGLGEDLPALLPVIYQLGQNYPNPFNPVTHIDFALPRPGHVSIFVFNILGQKVATIFDAQKEAGYHTVDWRGQGLNGTWISNGVYFYRMVAQSKGNVFVKTRKMVFLK